MAAATRWYSVLVRSDGDGGVLEEARVRLPGNPILGEGKPENQNCALPSTPVLRARPDLAKQLSCVPRMAEALGCPGLGSATARPVSDGAQIWPN